MGDENQTITTHCSAEMTERDTAHREAIENLIVRISPIYRLIREAKEPAHERVLLFDVRSPATPSTIVAEGHAWGTRYVPFFYDRAEMAHWLEHIATTDPTADGSEKAAVATIASPVAPGHVRFYVHAEHAVRVADCEMRPPPAIHELDDAQQRLLRHAAGDMALLYNDIASQNPPVCHQAILTEIDGPLSHPTMREKASLYQKGCALAFGFPWYIEGELKRLARNAPTPDGSEFAALLIVSNPVPPNQVRLYVVASGVVRVVLRPMPRLLLPHASTPLGSA